MRKIFVFPIAFAAALAGGAVQIVQDQCGPFTDVPPAFCPYVLELYFLGITAGTSATTYSPDDPLTRGQAAVFVAKGLNQSLARSSRRAALGQWWTPANENALAFSPPHDTNGSVVADGVDIWATSGGGSSVLRFRGSDGRLLETWANVGDPFGIIVAMGRVFADGTTGVTGHLYMIDPSQPVGNAVVAADVPQYPSGLGFDGSRIWVGGTGEVSIVTPSPTLPWSVTIAATKGFQSPSSFVFDGTNMWVMDFYAGSLFKLDSDGNILQTVAVGLGPTFPVFDGENIWVPNFDDHTLTVVQVATGSIAATLSGNGLASPTGAAFDGQRILVTNYGGDSVSLWNAANLAPLGSVFTGPESGPIRACSDGINFWITMSTGQIARF